jgi:DNA-binding transcriptional ArsR family regulator
VAPGRTSRALLAGLVAALGVAVALALQAQAAPDPCATPFHGSGVEAATDDPACGQGDPGQDAIRVGLWNTLTDVVVSLEVDVPFNQNHVPTRGTPMAPGQVPDPTSYLSVIGVAPQGAGMVTACYAAGLGSTWVGDGPDTWTAPLYELPGCTFQAPQATGLTVTMRWPSRLAPDDKRYHCNEVDFVYPFSSIPPGPGLGVGVGTPIVVGIHENSLALPVSATAYLHPGTTWEGMFAADTLGDRPLPPHQTTTFQLGAPFPLVPDPPRHQPLAKWGPVVRLTWDRAADNYVQPGFGFSVTVNGDVLPVVVPVVDGVTQYRYNHTVPRPGWYSLEANELNCRLPVAPLVAGPGAGLPFGGSDFPNTIYVPPVACTVPPVAWVGMPVTATGSGFEPGFDYTWTARGGSPFGGIGPDFTTTFFVPGLYGITVDGGFTEPGWTYTCMVNVLGPGSAMGGGGAGGCVPSMQVVAPGQFAVFAVTGAGGPVSWSAPGGTPSGGRGPTFSTMYSTLSSRIVLAATPTGVTTCTVLVSWPGGPYGLLGPWASAGDWSRLGGAIDDADMDGVADTADVCPNVPDIGQPDRDHDGVGDACDYLLLRTLEKGPARDGGWTPPDSDEDGIADMADNCPAVPNRTQADLDHDGLGDACDNDRDGDGILEQGPPGAVLDNCPDLPNVVQSDADGDGEGDACGGVAPAPAPPARQAPALEAAAGPTPSAGPAWLLFAAAGAAGILYALRRRITGGVVVLFSRIAGSDVASHPVRSRILDVLNAEPGLHFNEVVRRAGAAPSTTTHHLRILQSAGLVRQRRVGPFVQYFPPGPDPAPQRLLLRSDLARRILRQAATPGRSISDLAQAVGSSDRSVAYHLRRFERQGLVELHPEGRQVLVHLTATGFVLAERCVPDEPSPAPA